MKNSVIPLSVPKELERQIRHTAKKTHLSIQDVMRQSMIAGLPVIEIRLSPQGVVAASAEELEACYKKPNLDFDALEHHMASLPQARPSFDE